MKYLRTAALLLGGAIWATQSAFGQVGNFIANDLYLGFQNQAGGGHADYIINLGAATNIIGKSTVVDLSSYFSLVTFNNSSLQGTSDQIFGGVIGASPDQTPSDVYGTQLRQGGAGNPAVPGSTAPEAFQNGLSQSEDNQVAQHLANLYAPAVGAGVLDTSLTWEGYVEPTYTTQSYYGLAGFNPDSAVNTNTVLYEDLWFTSSSATRGTVPFVYQGYFTLDLTGATPKLTFTSTNVPASLSKPIIVSVKKTGSTITLVSSNTVPTYTYQLQYTASLSPTNWINVGSAQVAGAAMMTNTDTTATDSQRFYRIQAH